MSQNREQQEKCGIFLMSLASYNRFSSPLVRVMHFGYSHNCFVICINKVLERKNYF